MKILLAGSDLKKIVLDSLEKQFPNIDKDRTGVEVTSTYGREVVTIEIEEKSNPSAPSGDQG